MFCHDACCTTGSGRGVGTCKIYSMPLVQIYFLDVQKTHDVCVQRVRILLRCICCSQITWKDWMLYQAVFCKPLFILYTVEKTLEKFLANILRDLVWLLVKVECWWRFVC